MYFRNTKVYFQSTKVYSRSTKGYFQSTQMYFRNTKVYFQSTKVLFLCPLLVLLDPMTFQNLNGSPSSHKANKNARIDPAGYFGGGGVLVEEAFWWRGCFEDFLRGRGVLGRGCFGGFWVEQVFG